MLCDIYRSDSFLFINLFLRCTLKTILYLLTIINNKASVYYSVNRCFGPPLFQPMPFKLRQRLIRRPFGLPHTVSAELL